MKKLFVLLMFFILLFQINLKGQYIDSLIKVSSHQKDTVLGKTLLRIGNAFYNKGNLDSALIFFEKGYNYSQQINSQSFICDFLIRLGLIQREKGVYNKSSEYYYKALSIADKYNFPRQKASIYNGIAILSTIEKDFNKALESYNMSLDIYKKLENLGGQSSVYNNIGLVYLDIKENQTALKYFFKALEISTKLNDDFGTAINCENIGLIYHEFKNDNLAQIYFSKALKLWYKRNDENSIPITLGYISNNFIRQKKWDRAIDTLHKALEFAQRANSLTSKRDIAFHLSEAYEGSGDVNNAYKYYKEAKKLADSLQNNEKTKEITEIQMNYTFNKIKIQDSLKHQLEVQSKEKELKTEKNYTYVVSFVLVIILILLFFVFKNYKEKKKANEIITEQKNLVEQKQKEILDSMIYARRIQTALLANEEFISTNLSNHFILMKPKDIVSGDFYWAVKKDERFYLAVCDSTGHGVPGAFMSLLNMGFLSEAVIEKQIKEPDKVLNYVRERLITAISNEGQQDGFDGILLCIDRSEQSPKITYSSANSTSVLISNSGIQILQSDKMPVGKGIRNNPFQLNEIQLKKEDILYLYTDGYADQFGGPKGKKFMYKQLNQLLTNISTKDLQQQKNILIDTFDKWRGNLEQVDDVLIVGIKI